MLKFYLLIIISFTVLAQENNNNADFLNAQNGIAIEEKTHHEYVSLNDNKVYDVEIIVFAYQQSLPNYKTFTNKVLFDDSNALDLQVKPEDLDFIQYEDELLAQQRKFSSESENQNLTVEENENSSKLSVSITDNQEDKKVLVWFLHEPEFYKLTAIWERLLKQENIVPLIHKSWRQIETSFDNPTYVKLNNLPNVSENQLIQETKPDDVFEKNTKLDSFSQDNRSNFEINANGELLNNEDRIENKINAYADFSVSGMVALSKGRFLHFGHNLNLIRHYADDNNEMQSMIFSLTERKQLKPDELHYFDSPWFGSIVKITEYLGENNNE